MCQKKRARIDMALTAQHVHRKNRLCAGFFAQTHSIPLQGIFAKNTHSDACSRTDARLKRCFSVEFLPVPGLCSRCISYREQKVGTKFINEINGLRVLFSLFPVFSVFCASWSRWGGNTLEGYASSQTRPVTSPRFWCPSGNAVTYAVTKTTLLYFFIKNQ